MKKVNVSVKQMAKFAGQWVVIDPVRNRVTAVGETLDEIFPLVSHVGEEEKERRLPVGKAPFSFLVPRKDEGPYVLWVKL